MGDFRVVVEAAGGHGCNRTAKEGDEAPGCGGETCPDCITARYISALKRAGIHPKIALYTHWPAVMTSHLMMARKGGGIVCMRCGEEDARTMSGVCPEGTKYDADREVVDDLTERKVKYPGAIRAIPLRVKGAF